MAVIKNKRTKLKVKNSMQNVRSGAGGVVKNKRTKMLVPNTMETVSLEGGNFSGIELPATNTLQAFPTQYQPGPAVWVSVQQLGNTSDPLTNYSQTVWEYTAASKSALFISQNPCITTNCGSGEGYLELVKNGSVIYKHYLAYQSILALSDMPGRVNLNPDDHLELKFGFDNTHTNIWVNLYANIAVAK